MKKLKELYQQSLQELCHTKTVVLCGLLAALAIVLSMVASIQLGPYIKIERTAEQASDRRTE